MVHMSSWFPVFLVLSIAVVMVILLSYLSWLLGTKRPSAIKSELFECGSESSGTARQRFGVKFYVVALLFIVFDVEAVFLYPWAVQFQELGWYGFATMGVFVFTLAMGLIYVWKKGALEWE